MEEKHLLKYRIIESTSEDSENNLFELMKGHNSIGWSSIRFCNYPQEIILQFISPINLTQINILSHEKKIPSLIEFFSYYAQDSLEVLPNHKSLTFEKLGYIRMDDNRKTNYKARELRKVYIETNCFYLKIVLHKNYINKFNVFNQISLINLEFFGQPITHQMQVNDMILKENLNVLIKDSEIDETTQEKLRIMKGLMDEALKIEDYDLAKKIHNNLDKIKLFGKKILDLENQKKIYLKEEDYDSAKILKLEIDRIRSKIRNIDKQLSDINYIPLAQSLPPLHNSFFELNRSNITAIEENNENIYKERLIEVEKDGNLNKSNNKEINKEKEKEIEINKEKENSFIFMNENQNILNGNIDKSLLNKSLEKSFKEDGKFYEDQVIPALRKKSKLDQSNLNISSLINTDINLQIKEPFKGEINEIDQNIIISYEAFLPFLGEDNLKKLFSKYILLKEEGLVAFIKNFEDIINDKNQNFNQLVNLSLKLILFLLDEKHPQITIRVIDIYLNLLRKIGTFFSKGNKNNKETFPFENNLVDNILIKIREKLGNINAKLRTKTIEFFCKIIKLNIYDYNNILSELLEEEFKHIDTRKIIKSSKVIFGKLSIFDYVFDEFNSAIAEKRTDVNSFPLNFILSYSVENLSHSKSEIRKISRKILLKINQIFGFKKIESELKKTDEKELEKLISEIPEVNEIIKEIKINKANLLISATNRKMSASRNGNGIEKKRSLEKKISIMKKLNKSLVEKENKNQENSNNLHYNNINEGKNDSNINEKDAEVQSKVEKDNLYTNNANKNKALNINKIKQIICSYCGKSDKKYISQKDIDEHINYECVLFSNCTKCKKNIEIRELTEHMLSDCAFKSEFKLCKRCKEAIETNEYDSHVRENNCDPAKNLNSCNRCPLCHKDVPPLDKGFVQHLVHDSCPGSKRK